MEQVERITYYEKLMTGALEKLAVFERSLDDFIAVQASVSELGTYLRSAQWREDFEDSERGKLSAGLPCGVLSEDGIYNLLDRNKELIGIASCLKSTQNGIPEK